MNSYTRDSREQQRINREHFMMFHWIHFPECRTWQAKDIVQRLKVEGLVSRSTNAIDCPAIARFWRGLKK